MNPRHPFVWPASSHAPHPLAPSKAPRAPRSTWLVGALALALAGSAGQPRSAFAETSIPASPAEARAQAKKYFDQGALDYTQGNYEGAVEAWQKSYDLSKEPLIFENLGNAYERLGKPKEARAALSKWREVAPPEEHVILDRRIKNLDVRIAREDADALRKKQEDEAVQKKLSRINSNTGQNETPSGPAFSIPGVIVGGVGVVAIIAGVAVDGVASSKRPDKATVCKKSGTSQLCLESAKSDISSSNTMAIAGDVTWIIGAAAVAAGGVLLLTYKRPTTEPNEPPKTGQVDILPMAGPSGGGLSIRGLW